MPKDINTSNLAQFIPFSTLIESSQGIEALAGVVAAIVPSLSLVVHFQLVDAFVCKSKVLVLGKNKQTNKQTNKHNRSQLIFDSLHSYNGQHFAVTTFQQKNAVSMVDKR